MESLAHAMLSNALVATGLALVPLILGRFGRSPALVHSLWLVVLLKLVTPPIIQVPLSISLVPAKPNLASAAERVFHQNPPAPEPPDDRVPASQESVTENGTDHEDARAVEETETPINPVTNATRAMFNHEALPYWYPAFLALVATGALIFWSLAAVRIVRLHRLLGDLRPAPAEVQQQVHRVARQLHLRRFPTICLAPGRVPPMIWGLGFHARLLVPVDLWPDLNEGEQAALLTHELAHLKRKDHWVRWLDLAVAGLYWWHPLLWWARRGLREAEEQCCDAWAVWALPRGSTTYARALMAALDFISHASTAGVASAAAMAAVGGGGDISCLKRRMRMIARARTPRGLSWAARLGVLGLAALILPMAPTWAQKPDAPNPDRAPDGAAALARDKLQELTRELREARDELSRQRLKPKAEAEDDDNRPDADHLENLFKELGETLSKDLGPVGEEILKALEKATREVSDALGKEGIISKDLRQALERAGDELSQTFKEGGPLNEQARDAAEKARQDMRQAVEKAREEIREAVRDRVDKTREAARQGLQSQPGEKSQDDAPAAEADGSSRPGDVEQARREVRKMEQELRQAMRRLEAIQRREQRQSRGSRRGPGEATPQPPVPPRPPRPPALRDDRAAPASPEPPEGRTAPPAPPAPPVPPAPPNATRRFQGPDGRPMGMRGPVPPVLNPRVERRLEDLESKMDRLLKELENLRNEKKDKSKDRREESGATL
jgi:beta-lactamase regulating signal transducer with metallopeptidase domain/F0F1-type ATP synthase membrane subunit b/b'